MGGEEEGRWRSDDKPALICPSKLNPVVHLGRRHPPRTQCSGRTSSRTPPDVQVKELVDESRDRWTKENPNTVLTASRRM